MKFAVVNFGCRANRSDAESLAASLRAKGFESANRLQAADLVVINTCTVTAEAARQARQAIRRARKLNPHAIVVAAGCAVEAEPGIFLQMPEIDYTANLAARGELPDFVEELRHNNAPTPLERETKPKNTFPMLNENMSFEQDRARAVLKIQDGCENECSYCIVTRVRGKSRSLSTIEIIEKLELLAKLGHSEVVLTGIHLSAWGKDLLPSRTLEQLLKVIKKSNIKSRIRLTSIDPDQISSGIMKLIASDGICPHLHIPLQSGDDEILKAMGRKYSAHDAEVRLRLLRQHVPDMAIGMDMIVGFPGETDAHFENTLDLLDKLPFDYLHVFPFSPRPGTPAAKMPGKVPFKIIRERGRVLRDLSSKRQNHFWNGHLGTVRDIVVESHLRNGNGFRGRTDNYIPVVIGPGDWRIGETLPARLISVKERKVKAEVSL